MTFDNDLEHLSDTLKTVSGNNIGLKKNQNTLGGKKNTGKLTKEPPIPPDSLINIQYSADTIKAIRKGDAKNLIFDNEGLFHPVQFKPNSRDSLVLILTPVEEYKGKTKLSAKERNTYKLASDWMLFIFLMISLSIVWARMFYQKYFNTIFQATFRAKTAAKLFRDKNILLQKVSMALNAMAVFSISIYLFLVLKTLDGSHKAFGIPYIYVFGAVLAVFINKYLITLASGYILMYKNLFAEYLQVVFIFYKTIGAILIPISILAAYLPIDAALYILAIGAVPVIILLAYRFIRFMKIFLPEGISIFYLFLYFCTLEILPVVILIKLSVTL